MDRECGGGDGGQDGAERRESGEGNALVEFFGGAGCSSRAVRQKKIEDAVEMRGGTTHARSDTNHFQEF